MYLLMAFFMLNGITMVLNFTGLSVTIPVMMLVVFFMVYFWARRDLQRPYFYLFFLLAHILYLGISLFSLFILQKTHFSIDIPYQLRSIIYNLIIVYVFYRFILDRLHQYKFHQVIHLLFIAVAIGGILTLYSGLFGLYSVEVKSMSDDPSKIVEERLSGVYANPNLAGFVANIGLLLSLTLMFSKSTMAKIIGVAGIVFSISTAVATFSKTSFLQCGIIIIVFLIVFLARYKKIEKRTRRGIGIVLLAIVSLLVPISVYLSSAYDELTPFQQERIEQLSQLVTEGKVNSDLTTNRSDAVADGLTLIASHPFMGNGFMSFLRLENASAKTGEDIGIHNTFLLVLGDAGIVPFILYVIFHLLCFVSFFKIRDTQLFYFAITLLISTSFFNTTNHEALANPLQAVIMGIFCALATYAYWSGNKEKILEHNRITTTG
ncbi:MAG: O-antigen ligase family protein [Chitinophagaceae bacterium]